MNIALILPPISLEERYGKGIAKVAGSLPPLGLLSIGAVLREGGHKVIVIDGSREDFSTMMLRLQEFLPQIIGISSMTCMWPKAKQLAAILRNRFPNSFLIAGGVHPTLMKEACLAEVPSLDAVVYGEGEYTALELCNKIEGGESLSAVNGLIYRDDGEIVKNPPREIIANLDLLPFPDRELVDVRGYTPAFEQYKRKPVTNVFTARGCPFQCIFCLPNLLGKRVRYRSPENVMAELKELKERYGIRDVAFWDDTFTLNKKRIYALSDMMKSENLGIVWSAQARADCVDRDLLREMADAGCWKLFYGVESLVQKNLDTLKKGETVEQMFDAIRWTKEAGIETETSYIFGIPGETYEEGLETIKLAKKLDPDYAKFFALAPYGKLYEEAEKYGTLLTKNMSDFTGNTITFVPYSMTKNQLEKLRYLAYRKFYLRPAYILKRIKKLRSLEEIKKSINGFIALITLTSESLKSK